MLFKYGIYRGYIQNAIGPKIELFQHGCIEALAGCFIKRTKAFDEKTFQDRRSLFGLAFEFAFQPALL